MNAYYNPTTNEICFPAAILQPPFFNPEADDAVNYGAIGVVIGHEMTHGFDDQGRNYDKEGNLSDWWTAEDAALFTQRADRLAQQYSDIIVVDSVHATDVSTWARTLPIRADGRSFSISQFSGRKRDTGPIDGLPMNSVLSGLRQSLGTEYPSRRNPASDQDRPALIRQVACQCPPFATLMLSTAHSISKKANRCICCRLTGW